MQRKPRFPLVVLVALAVLTLFVVQNASSAVAVTFLGMRSLALPVGVWVAGAFAAGWLTAGAIALLWRGTGRGSGHVNVRRGVPEPERERARRIGSSAAPSGDPNWVDEEPPPQARRPMASASYAEPRSASDSDSDLETVGDRADYRSEYRRESRTSYGDDVPEYAPDGDGEIWDDEADWEEVAASSEGFDETQAEATSGRSYEVEQKPIPSDRQGTIYSFSYERNAEPEASPDAASEEPSSAFAGEASDEPIAPDDAPPTPPLDREPLTPDGVPRSPADATPTAAASWQANPADRTSTEDEGEFDEFDEFEVYDELSESPSSPSARSSADDRRDNRPSEPPPDDDWKRPRRPPENW